MFLYENKLTLPLAAGGGLAKPRCLNLISVKRVEGPKLLQEM